MASTSSPREKLVPTINFSMVCQGVYRSGYPTKKNYSFLRALRLHSILYLCPEDYAESNLKFCEENGIHVLRFPTEGNKEPFNDISEPLMHRILGAICDTRNLPLLIHCNKGKHRTGTVVACLRHLQGWSLVSIFEEYKRFASDKARVGDQQYVELYHPIVKLTPPFVAPWVTITPRVTLVTSDRELIEAEAIQLGTSLLAPDKPSKKVGKVSAVAVTTATVVVPPQQTTAPAATSVSVNATSPVPANPPASAAAAQVPPPSSPNTQASPSAGVPLTGVTPTTTTTPATASAGPSSSPGTNTAGPAQAGSATMSTSMLPPPPPPPVCATQQLCGLLTAHNVHAPTNSNHATGSNSNNTAAPSSAVPTSSVAASTTTITSTDIVTGATADASGEDAANTTAPHHNRKHPAVSTGGTGRAMPPSASWYFQMSAPTSPAFTTAPPTPPSSHVNTKCTGGMKTNSSSVATDGSTPMLDKGLSL